MTFSSSRTLPGQSLSTRRASATASIRTRAHANPSCRAVGEVRGEQGNVLAPLAQRRNAKWKDGEAVIEIGAEPALAHFVLEVAIGRGDDAHVDAVNTVAADTLNLPVLQGAQQLWLQFERQLADLVEEQRAAVGDLELAGAIFATAPVNAPDTWPNSSLSAMLTGSAAQFT